ncbi:Hypothetical protein HVR_LOCUS719 [uncultured virus]|nr:Hypothetical protein HVR_LOCUS719 [uncultured virus]
MNSKDRFHKLLHEKGATKIFDECREISRLYGTGTKLMVPILPGIYADLSNNKFIFIEDIEAKFSE